MDYRTKQSEAFKLAHSILTHLELPISLQQVATLAHFLLQPAVDQTSFHKVRPIEPTPSQKNLFDKLNGALSGEENGLQTTLDQCL